MSTEQQENLDAVLRQSAFPVRSDVNELRRLLRELVSAQSLPADVTMTAAALGGVPTAEITVDGIEPRHVVLYFHGICVEDHTVRMPGPGSYCATTPRVSMGFGIRRWFVIRCFTTTSASLNPCSMSPPSTSQV